MRSLSATLLAAQKSASVDALYKIALSKTGQSTLTYTASTIISIDHDEDRFGGEATVILDNSDQALNELDLKAYTGTISYGAVTGAGDEYSACPPLLVVGQQLYSAEGVLRCLLYLLSGFKLLSYDTASSFFVGAADSTDTIKTIFTAVAGATQEAFTHCQAYTVDWISEDSLVDVFQPKDTFYINQNETRLNCLRKLLSWTSCVMRWDTDNHIDVFVPTVS